MRFLRYPLGVFLVVLGAASLGTYLAIELTHPAAWTGTSANPAICFFQSAFFILGGKPAAHLVLLGGGGIALALGAFLIRGITALLFTASLGSFTVLGAAAAAERQGGGTEPFWNIARGVMTLVQKNPRDTGIIAGLGISLLLIVVFTAIWRQIRTAKPAKAKPKSKAAASADD